MIVKATKILCKWVFFNALVPVIFPIFLLMIGDWLFEGHIAIEKSIKKLMYEGFYIFSAITLIFNLLENYSAFKKAVTPLAAMVMMIPAVCISIIFYQTEKEGLCFFTEHVQQFILVWIFMVLCAAYLKYKIIYYNLKYGYNG